MLNTNTKAKYLGAISVLSLMSILLASGFIDELSAEKSVGRSANEYGSATKGKICGDKLCSETGGKILMPWEETSNDTQIEENSTSNDTQIEENATSTINEEIEEDNSLDVNATALADELLSNANVPVTIPLQQGYYMGKAVYYIITDSSESTYADVIAKYQGSKVNHAPLLANATEDALSKTYVFTNGVPGDGVNGFQGAIFTSTPEQTDTYSALISHVNVTWNAGAIPIILDSERELQNAIKRGYVTLTEEDVVSNVPQIVWPEGQMPVKANKTLTNETPFVGAQVLDIDLENKTTTFIAHKSWDAEGKTIYFIVTDATPVGPAVSLGVPYTPKIAALISNPAAVDMFHFTNGVQGPGPFGFQPGIVSGSVEDETYSPMSRIYVITWSDPDNASLLLTRSAIDEFEKDELITVDIAKPMAADHIVNTPLVDPFQYNFTNPG